MKKLRIGFLLQSENCPRWQQEILQRVEENDQFSIELLAFNAETIERKQNEGIDRKAVKRSFFANVKRLCRIGLSIINPRGYGLYNIYHRFDEKYNRQENDLWSTTDIDSFKHAKK